ncbi:MAG: phosphoglucomutase/phosphomannomutase family protein [Thermosulfidibacteraceae bacterium]|jgi:alpha-D-glucose phosphate-specific phosphoglucomutase
METAIKFGTDGWRGIIAKDATFHNYERLTQAVSSFVKSNWPYEKGVFIGYDTRFFSEEFAKVVASVFAGNGIKVALSARSVPTPFVTFAIKKYGYGFGVSITASHNPYNYNGFKLRTPLGGACGKEYSDIVESLIGREDIKKVDFEEALSKGLIEVKDIYRNYIEWIGSKIDLDLIASRGYRIIVDPMYGSANNLLRDILSPYGLGVETMNEKRDAFFGFKHPEPIEKNLLGLIARVKESGADIGIATDGDGDRVGLIDERGRFISPHKIYALILSHLLENRSGDLGGVGSSIAKTVSTTSLLNRIADRYGITIIETAVGFKYMAELLAKGEIIMGGEESGGIGVCFHIPERDGSFSALLVLEYMASKKKTLAELVDELDEKYGTFYYRRLDLKVKSVEFAEELVRGLIERSPSSIKGKRVVSRNDIDGVKFILEDGSWILFRASGTEPLLRIYMESQDLSFLDELEDYGREKSRIT